MLWLIAQADAATKEAVSNRLISLFENVINNPITITFLFALAVIVITTIVDFQHKRHKLEIEATLKQQMIERGMSADEIERVLAAKIDPKAKKANLADKQTSPYPDPGVK